jgi:hypothetical protein
MTMKENFYFEDVVEYTCNLGYELIGNSVLTCDSTGQWNFQPPICNGK